jgi:hypothetical protein
VRREALGGAQLEWTFAFLLCAGGFAGLFAAGVSGWNPAADVAAAGAGSGAMLGLVAAFSGLLHRYTRGPLGAPRVRTALFAAGLALVSLGVGAAVGAAGTPGDGEPAAWAIVPVAAGTAGLVPVVALACLRSRERATMAGLAQLAAGAGAVAFGLLAAALGDIFVGPFVGAAGAGVLYSGVLSVVGRAPAQRSPVVTPMVEPKAAPRAVSSARGRKVRVPKGAAVRVSSFRDDAPEAGEVK